MLQPYQNHSSHAQNKEFHYSGSFGVPIQNQSHTYIDINGQLVSSASVLNPPANNLSFSIVGQNDMSIVSQEQVPSSQHAYLNNQGAIVIEDENHSDRYSDDGDYDSAVQ